jgi:hypothetical protein
MPPRNKVQARQLKAIAAAKKLDPWETLKGRIQEYTEAAIAESWKGGGDPSDIEIHELRLRLTWIELCNHIARMKESFT